jgi:hypothetical protein
MLDVFSSHLQKFLFLLYFVISTNKHANEKWKELSATLKTVAFKNIWPKVKSLKAREGKLLDNTLSWSG